MITFTLLVHLPDSIVREHNISKEYCEQYRKDCITHISNLLGQKLFVIFSDMKLHYSTEYTENTFAMTVKENSKRHHKYLSRRYESIKKRFGLIQYSIPVFYENGKNMTLSKQPHQRHINHQRAWRVTNE